MNLKTFLTCGVFLAALIGKANAGQNRSVSHKNGDKRVGVRTGFKKWSQSKAMSGYYMSNGKCTYFDSKPTGNVLKCRPKRKKPAKSSKGNAIGGYYMSSGKCTYFDSKPAGNVLRCRQIRRKSAKMSNANAVRFRKKTVHNVGKQNDTKAESGKPGEKVKAKKRRAKLRKKKKVQTGLTRTKKVKNLAKNDTLEAKDNMPSDQPISKRTQDGMKNEKFRAGSSARRKKLKKPVNRRKKVIKSNSQNMTNDQPILKPNELGKRTKNDTTTKRLRKKSSSLKTPENSNQTLAKSKTTQPISNKAPQTLIYEPGSKFGKCYKFVKGRKTLQPEYMCFHYEWTKVNGQLKCRVVVTTGQNLPVEFADDKKCPKVKDIAEAVTSSQINEPDSKSSETKQLYVYDPSTGCRPLLSHQSNKRKVAASGKLHRKTGKFRKKVKTVKSHRQKRTVKGSDPSSARRKVRKRTKAKTKRANRPANRRKMRLKNSGKILQKEQIIYKSRQECVTDNPHRDDPAPGRVAAPAIYGPEPNKTADTKVIFTNAPAAKTEGPKVDKATTGATARAPVESTTKQSKTKTAGSPFFVKELCTIQKDYFLRISEEACIAAGDFCERLSEDDLKAEMENNPDYPVEKFIIKDRKNTRELSELECIKEPNCYFCSEEDFKKIMERVAAITLVPSTAIPAATTPAPTIPAPTVPLPTMPAPTVPLSTMPAPTVPPPTMPAPTMPAPTRPAPTVRVPTIPAAPKTKAPTTEPPKTTSTAKVTQAQTTVKARPDTSATSATQKPAWTTTTMRLPETPLVAQTTATEIESTTTKRKHKKYRSGWGWGSGCCSSSSKKRKYESEEESTTTIEPTETEQPNPDSSFGFVNNNPATPDLADLICALHSGRQILTICLIPMDLNANSECLIQHGTKKGLCFDPNTAAQSTVNRLYNTFASKSRKWKSLKTNSATMNLMELSGLINQGLLESSDSDNAFETASPDKCETMMRTVPVSESVYEKIAKECSFNVNRI